MHREKALVPVSKEVENQPPVIVDTEQLSRFLVGTESYFPHKRWSFAQQLDLSVLTSTISTLHHEASEVYIYPESERKHLRETFGQSYLPEVWEKKGDAERTQTIFYDDENHLLRVSPIAHGDFASVKTATLQYMDDMMIPYLEIHTHPDNSLPSPVDYTRMITQGYESGRAIVRGMMVLCPDIQILALPTPFTPVLSPDNAAKVIAQASTAFKEIFLPLEIKRRERIIKIGNAAVTRLATLSGEKQDIEKEEIERREFDGAISQSEGAELREELNAEFDTFYQMLADRQRFLTLSSNIKFYQKQRLAENQMFIQFARQLNIELFTSIDMEKFTSWTA
jgi:hypothetical protein